MTAYRLCYDCAILHYKSNVFKFLFDAEDASRRLKSLRDPTKKMSKSEKDPRSRINLCDSPEDIFMKFKKAVTDCTSTVSYEPDTRPGISNLVVIHSSLTGRSIDTICLEAIGIESGV